VEHLIERVIEVHLWIVHHTIEVLSECRESWGATGTVRRRVDRDRRWYSRRRDWQHRVDTGFVCASTVVKRSSGW